MALNWGIRLIGENLKVAPEFIVLLIACLGCIVFFAKDFRLGSIVLFVISAVVFMGTYALELNYSAALIVMFMALIMLALSFYGVGSTQTKVI